MIKIAAVRVCFEFWWDVKLAEVISDFCKRRLSWNVSIWREFSIVLQVTQSTLLSTLETPTYAAVPTEGIVFTKIIHSWGPKQFFRTVRKRKQVSGEIVSLQSNAFLRFSPDWVLSGGRGGICCHVLKTTHITNVIWRLNPATFRGEVLPQPCNLCWFNVGQLSTPLCIG